MNELNNPAQTRKKVPLAVRIILLGTTSRVSVLASACFSVVLAGIFVILRMWIGILMLTPALCYWFALRWMDKNDAWPKPPTS